MSTETTTAVCKYCGQSIALEIDNKYFEMSGSERIKYIDDLAIQNCKCEKARNKRKEVLHKNFKSFIFSDVVNFLDRFDLEEVSVKTSEGFKGKVKKDKNGNLKVETTINEVV